jgi:ribosome recycling factor
MDLDPIREKMEKTLSFLRDELAQIRAGRATPSLVEKILVAAYGSEMPLVELATISIPEPNQLLVTPFDQSIIKEIEKAIRAHKDLGLSPVIDEEVVRIKIPPLTEERRKELTRVLNQKLEAGRVAIRQIRHEGRSMIKRVFEDGELNEDEKRSLEEKLQEITDAMNQEIQKMGDLKTEEIKGGW